MEILEQGSLELMGKECFGSLEEVIVHQSLGNHGFLKALVWLRSGTEWDENSKQWQDMPVTLIPRGREREPIFSGIVTSSIFLQIGGRPAVELKAYSYTIIMDRRNKDRSFQQESNTYGGLVRSILVPYKGAYIWNREGRDEPVGRFLMQYRESDWEFLRRIASFYGHPVIPEVRFPGAKMFIGLPAGRNAQPLDTNQYRIKKNLEKAVRNLDNKTTGGLSEGLEIEVKDCYEDYCLGDLVEFLNVHLVVTEKHSSLKRGEWLHDYRLRPAQNCKMERMDNLKLAGAAIRGRVLGSSLTSTMLELETDMEEGGKESWHVQPVYYAGGGKGYSGQPEKGDSQYLFFPTMREEDRYILGGADAGEEKITSIVGTASKEAAAGEAKGGTKEVKAADTGSQTAPQAISKTKSWTTPGNQKLILNESGISLSNGKQARISVTGSGINISSSGSLSLETGDILGHGKNIKMNAKEYVWISCEESGVLLLPEEVHLKAEEIYIESPENEPHEIVREDAVENLLSIYENAKKSIPPLFASDGSVIRRSGYDDILFSEELFGYFQENVYGKGDYENPIGQPVMNYYDNWLDEIYGKTKAKKFWEHMQTLDGFQDMLSAAGIFFEGADLLNSFIYAVRGEGTEAIFSLINVLPVVGDIIGKGGKLTMKGGTDLALKLSKDGKRMVEGLELVYKTTAEGTDLLKRKIDDALDLMSRGMYRDDAYRRAFAGGGYFSDSGKITYKIVDDAGNATSYVRYVDDVAIEGSGKIADIGEGGKKLDYLFGKASGTKHNIERSAQMKNELAHIGIHDTPDSRNLLGNHLNDVLNDSTNITGTELRSYVAKELPGTPTITYIATTRESLFMGPSGGVMFESVWDGDRLLTVIVKGGH